MNSVILDMEKLCKDFNTLQVELTLYRREYDPVAYDASNELYVSVTQNSELITKEPFDVLLHTPRSSVKGIKRYTQFITTILLSLGYDTRYAEHDSVSNLLRSLLLDAVERNITFKQDVITNFPTLSPAQTNRYTSHHTTGALKMQSLYKEVVENSSSMISVSFDVHKIFQDAEVFLNIYTRGTKETTKVSVQRLWFLEQSPDLPTSIFNRYIQKDAQHYASCILPSVLRAFSLTELAQYKKVIQLAEQTGLLSLFSSSCRERTNITKERSVTDLPTNPQPNLRTEPTEDCPLILEGKLFGTLLQDYDLNIQVTNGITLQLTTKDKTAFLSNLTIPLNCIQKGDINLILFTQSYFIHHLTKQTWASQEDPTCLIFDKDKHTEEMVETLTRLLTHISATLKGGEC